MKVKRRLGAENAKNRARLIEATERLMRDEGYAAVTARKVADEAGLKMPLVYYYFQTMDDLILEMVRKGAAKRRKKLVRALASRDPLRALWQVNRDSSSISGTELVALANHRESVRSEVVAVAREVRSLQIEAVDRLLSQRRVDQDMYPAGGLVAIITALTRAMAQDYALGVTEGYNEAVALVESLLDSIAREAPQDSGSATGDWTEALTS